MTQKFKLIPLLFFTLNIVSTTFSLKAGIQPVSQNVINSDKEETSQEIANPTITDDQTKKATEASEQPQLIFSKEMIIDFQDMAHTHMDQLLSIFNSIGQALQNKLFKKVKNPDLIRTQLVMLQQSLQDLRSQSSLHIDKFQLVLLGRIVQEFSRILTVALQNKLTTIPQLEHANIVKKDKIVTVETVVNLYTANQLLLNALEKLTVNAPLLWYNHATRAVTSFWHKYGLGPIAERLTIYSAMAAWALFLFPEQRIENNFLPRKITDFLKKAKNKIGGRQGTAKREIQQNQISVTVERGSSGEIIDVKPAPVAFIDAKTALDVDPSSIPNTATIYNHDNNPAISESIQNALITTKSDHPIYPNEDKGYLTKFVDHIEPLCVIGGEAFGALAVSKWFAEYAYNDLVLLKKKCAATLSDIRDFLEARKSKKDYYEGKKDTNFDNILGREHIKKRFAPLIDYIVHQERYTRAGIKIPCGFLLAGPPQTGKTFLVECLAGEIARALKSESKNDALRVFTVSVHDILDTDKNGKQAGVSYWVARAREHAPCIIFIDEFDNLRAQRDSNATLLAECLQVLHESILSDERCPVFVIAATNRPENIDYALRQPGRFGEVVYFPFPLRQDRTIYFEDYFKKRAMNTAHIDLDMLVRSTEGCSYGVMQVVANKILTYAKELHEPIAQKHVTQAVNDAIKQIVKYDQPIPDKVKRIIATRFASKALTSLVINPDQKLCSVTIEQVIKDVGEVHVSQRLWMQDEEKKQREPVDFGGIFSYYTDDTLNMISVNEKIKQIKIALAGNIGQEVIGGMDFVNHESDLKLAFDLAKEIIFEGLNPDKMSRYDREKKLGQSCKLVEECKQEVLSLLSLRKEILQNIIQALIKCDSLSAEEILEIGDIQEIRDTSIELLKKAQLFTPKMYVHDAA